jgi:hypothetical protein
MVFGIPNLKNGEPPKEWPKRSRNPKRNPRRVKENLAGFHPKRPKTGIKNHPGKRQNRNPPKTPTTRKSPRSWPNGTSPFLREGFLLAGPGLIGLLNGPPPGNGKKGTGKRWKVVFSK